MEQRTVFKISEFLGLNSRDSDLEIRDGESPDLLNIEFFQNGFRSRPGTGLIAQGSDSIGAYVFIGMFEGYNHLLAMDNNGKAYSFGPVTGDWTEIASGLTLSYWSRFPVFASYNGLDMMVNGSAYDNPQKWDGSTWTDLGGSPPKADDISVWRNHVFLTGLASPNEGEVRFSELESPEVWPSGSWLRPTKRESGARLVCSKVCPFPGEEDGTRLVVFADDRIYHFDGFTKSLFQIFTVRKGVGSISKRGVVSAENYTFWLDRAGIFCTTDGGYTINNVSWNIQPTLDALLSTGMGVHCCAVHNKFKRQVWFSFQSAAGAYHDTVLVYSYGLSTPMTSAIDPAARHVWSKYDISAPCMEAITTPFEGIIGGEGTAGSALLGYGIDLDPRADAARSFALKASGRDVAYRYKTKRFMMGQSPSQYGVLRKASIMHAVESNGTVTAKLYKDFSRTVDGSEIVNLYGEADLLDTDFMLDSSYLGAGDIFASSIWYNSLMQACQIELSGTVNYSNPNGLVVDPIEGAPGSRSDPSSVHDFYEIALEVTPKAGTR